MRGYIKDIDGQAHWFDVEDKPHSLQEMEDQYITNCIKLLEARMLKIKYPDNITFMEEIKQFNEELNRRANIRTTKIGRLVYG